MFRIGTTLFFAGSARVLYVPPSRMGPSGLRSCSPPSARASWQLADPAPDAADTVAAANARNARWRWSCSAIRPSRPTPVRGLAIRL